MLYKLAVLLGGSALLSFLNYLVLASVRTSIRTGNENPFLEKMLFGGMAIIGLSIILVFTGFFPRAD